MAAYRAAYNRPPTYYAANAYDTARLIGTALQASDGQIDDKFRAALKRADFESVRGHFAFAANQGPVQDWYELAVIRGDDGNLGLKTLRKFRDMVGGAYGDECKMK